MESFKEDLKLIFAKIIRYNLVIIQAEGFDVQTCVCICNIYMNTQKSSSGWGLSLGFGYIANQVI